MRILLLEDDRETASALERGLGREGYEVSVAHDVAAALDLISTVPFDVAVLDVRVPGGSGFDVLERLRSDCQETRTLMLTALGSVENRVEGLDRGADDYLVKPFSFSELVARVRAMSRRRPEDAKTLQVHGLEVDLLGRVASTRNRRLDLTPTEFSLLATLLRADGQALSRSELLREIWGYDFDPRTNVVDVHVNRLRRKLEDAGVADLIRTVRGRGYAAT